MSLIYQSTKSLFTKIKFLVKASFLSLRNKWNKTSIWSSEIEEGFQIIVGTLAKFMRRKRRKSTDGLMFQESKVHKEENLSLQWPIAAKNHQNLKLPTSMKVTLLRSKTNWTNQMRYLIVWIPNSRMEKTMPKEVWEWRILTITKLTNGWITPIKFTLSTKL